MMTMKMRIMRTTMVMMRTIINDHDNDGDKKDDEENGRTDNHGTSYSSLLLLAAQPFLPASLVQGREPKLFIMGEFLILKKTQNSF